MSILARAGRLALFLGISSATALSWATWPHVFPGQIEGKDTTGNALVADRYGNVYVAGASQADNSSTDGVIYKLNQKGFYAWGPFFPFGSALGSDGCTDIKLMGGYIYVAGYIFNSGTGRDAFAVKLNASTGAIAPGWPQFVTGFGATAATGVKIAVDPEEGAVVLLATADTAGTGPQIVTMKWSSGGAPYWPTPNVYSAPALTATAVDLKIRKEGAFWSIYWCGYGDQGAPNDNDYVVRKIQPIAGTTVWTKVYDNRFDNDYTSALALETTETGHVYCTGRARFTGFGDNVVTLKLTAAGDYSPTWPSDGSGVGVRQFFGSGNFNDAGTSIVVAGTYCFVGGYFTAPLPDEIGLLLAYDGAGASPWGPLYFSGVAGGSDRIQAIDYSPGLVHFAGRFTFASGINTDYFYGRVDAVTGAVIASGAVFGDPFGRDDEAKAMALAPGLVYLTGDFRSQVSGSDKDIATVKIWYGPPWIFMGGEGEPINPP